MRLDEFIDDFEVDIEAKKRELAKERSYEILDYLPDIQDQLEPVKNTTHLNRGAPDIFVGRTGYPNISTGILAPTDPESNPLDHVTNAEWYTNQVSIGDVMQRRTGLLNNQHQNPVSVHDVWDGFVGAQREIAIAQDPVDVEMNLDSAPNVDLALDDVSAPTGPIAQATDATITTNPKVPKPIKKTLHDDDWNATGAINYLYNRGFDVYEINSILSAGALGEADNRRLVPTRWSITAVDDTLGQYLHGQIRNNRTISSVEVYRETFMGNRYWVVLSPGQWEYELVEMKCPGSIWNPEETGDVWLLSAHEEYGGRTQYVEETSGAYYAARLGVLEHLVDRGRQAKALVLREVSDDYWAPVGVWQIRESVRNAFNTQPGEAESFHQALGEILPVLPITRDQLLRKSTMASGLQTDLKRYLM